MAFLKSGQISSKGSLGVQWQRRPALALGSMPLLGMARLFYHRPKFAILDECTSGVTVRAWSGLRVL